MRETKPFIFATSDWWGNTVNLSKERWEHITEAHPDTTGHQRALKLTVENPSIVYESTSSPDCLIFHGHGLLAPRPNIVRVVMRYEAIADVKSGTPEASIVTAFTPSPATELSGQIGSVFYKRPKPAKTRRGRRR